MRRKPLSAAREARARKEFVFPDWTLPMTRPVVIPSTSGGADWPRRRGVKDRRYWMAEGGRSDPLRKRENPGPSVLGVHRHRSA